MKQKKEWIRFLCWWRNGSAFCISWFLILWLFVNTIYKVPFVSTDKLIELVKITVVGVFFFCTFFTGLFIKKWRFVTRLTCFLIVVSILECIAFYRLGIFGRVGTWQEWTVFIGIILILYGICIGIYSSYSRRKGAQYTKALEQYQQNRSKGNGE